MTSELPVSLNKVAYPTLVLVAVLFGWNSMGNSAKLFNRSGLESDPSALVSSARVDNVLAMDNITENMPQNGGESERMSLVLPLDAKSACQPTNAQTIPSPPSAVGCKIPLTALK